MIISENLFPIPATLLAGRSVVEGGRSGCERLEGTFQTESTKLSVQNMLPGNQNDLRKYFAVNEGLEVMRGETGRHSWGLTAKNRTVAHLGGRTLFARILMLMTG